jgi:hypothetical protein
LSNGVPRYSTTPELRASEADTEPSAGSPHLYATWSANEGPSRQSIVGVCSTSEGLEQIRPEHRKAPLHFFEAFVELLMDAAGRRIAGLSGPARSDKVTDAWAARGASATPSRHHTHRTTLE